MHVVRKLAVGAIAAAGLAGCVANSGDTSLLVLHNQAPQSGCTVTADQTGAFLASGQYDLQLYRAGGVTTVAQGYLLTPLVENTAIADVSDPSAISRRTAIVQGAHVEISFLDDTEFSADAQAQLAAQGLTKFDARFAGAISPNNGLTSFAFEAVPAGVFDAILANHPYSGGTYTPFSSVGMIVKIKVYGQVGGNSVESNDFEYPVSVCDGCLLNDVGSCDTLSTGFTARTGGACNVSQDGVIDCCDGTTGLTCPAVSTSGGA